MQCDHTVLYIHQTRKFSWTSILRRHVFLSFYSHSCDDSQATELGVRTLRQHSPRESTTRMADAPIIDHVRKGRDGHLKLSTLELREQC